MLLYIAIVIVVAVAITFTGVLFVGVAMLWPGLDLDRLETVARIYRQHLAPRLFYRLPPGDDP